MCLGDDAHQVMFAVGTSRCISELRDDPGWEIPKSESGLEPEMEEHHRDRNRSRLWVDKHFLMCFISAGIHYRSDYLPVSRLHPTEAADRSDSQLANICRLMSPLTAITTHNVITPLNSLFPSALWLLLPYLQPSAHTQSACFHCSPHGFALQCLLSGFGSELHW